MNFTHCLAQTHYISRIIRCVNNDAISRGWVSNLTRNGSLELRAAIQECYPGMAVKRDTAAARHNRAEYAVLLHPLNDTRPPNRDATAKRPSQTAQPEL